MVVALVLSCLRKEYIFSQLFYKKGRPLTVYFFLCLRCDYFDFELTITKESKTEYFLVSQNKFLDEVGALIQLRQQVLFFQPTALPPP